MSDSPSPAEPDPELLRAFREPCDLLGRLWRPKDEASGGAGTR